MHHSISVKYSNVEKLNYGDGNQNSGYFQMERGRGPERAFWDAKNVLYLQLGSSFMSAYKCKNSLG